MKFIALLFLLAWTSEGLPFDWNIHRSITTRSLLPLGFSVEALDQISDANISIDSNEDGNPSIHFDNEAFEDASRLMRTRLAHAALAMTQGDVRIARKHFGYLLHTTQDFYAHTNYVEFIPGQSLDLLNMANPPADVTCSRTHKKAGLTSGYYPDAKTPARKCSHTVLNKDSGINTKAIDYARTATVLMYQQLEKEVAMLIPSTQKREELLSHFKDSLHASHQNDHFQNYDEASFVSHNETFKVIPFVGITHYTKGEADLNSSYALGLRIESRVNEKFTTGLGLSHNSIAQSYTDYSSDGADLYGKFYFSLESRAEPYLGVGVSYLQSTTSTSPFSLIKTKSLLSAEALGGLDVMFTRNMGFNLEAKFIESQAPLVLTAGMIISF